MSAVKERPHSFCFSKNEIRYKFELLTAYAADLFLQVKIFCQDLTTGDVEEIESLKLSPNQDNVVWLYLQEYLDSMLTYTMPTPGEVFTTANTQARRFYIHFREITAADPDPAWDDTEEAKKRIVIKGGVEKQKHARNNYFINHFDVAKPFLTWQPQGRFIANDQKAYLTFLNKLTVTAGMKLKVAVTDDDGDVTPHDIAIPNGDITLLHIAADLATLDIVSVKPVHHYSISVLSAADEVLAGPYKFYQEKNPVYEVYDLVYHNSLSGIDFVRILGDQTLELEREFEEIEGGFSLNDWLDTTKAHEVMHAGITGRRTFKGDIGYVNTKKEQEALLELLFSRSIYQMIDERWIPVIITSRTHTIRKISAKKFGFPIEWRLSTSNEVFTPSHTNLGEGEDLEVY